MVNIGLLKAGRLEDLCWESRPGVGILLYTLIHPRDHACESRNSSWQQDQRANKPRNLETTKQTMVLSDTWSSGVWHHGPESERNSSPMDFSLGRSRTWRGYLYPHIDLSKYYCHSSQNTKAFILHSFWTTVDSHMSMLPQ